MIRASDLTPPLIALCVAAAAGGIALIGTVSPSGATLSGSLEADDGSPPAPPQLVSSTIGDFSDYAVIADRPVFNANHAKDYVPPPPVVEPQGPQLPPLSDYRLVGIIVSGDTKRALVEHGDATARSLKLGDDLDGRRVVAIDGHSIRLTGNDREETLRFPKHEGGNGHGVAMNEGSAQGNR